MIHLIYCFLFIIITLFEMGLQILMIFVGNAVFHVSYNGITGVQWGICIGFSAITFVVSFIAKLIPLEKLIDKFLDKKEEDDNNDDNQDNKENIEELNIIEDNQSNNKLKIKEKNRITRNKNQNINSSERNMNSKIMSFKKERDDKDHLQISQASH